MISLVVYQLCQEPRWKYAESRLHDRRTSPNSIPYYLSTIEDNMLRSTAGMSVVFATLNARPGSCFGILVKISAKCLHEFILESYQVDSAPSPMQINAVFTLGCLVIARLSSSGVMLYLPKFASVIAITNQSSVVERTIKHDNTQLYINRTCIEF